MPSLRASASDLSASMCHFLMCGSAEGRRLAPARLPGWLDCLLLIADDDAVKVLWQTHGAALRAEAEAEGFMAAGAIWFDRDGNEPNYVNDVAVYRLPPDAARDEWSARFCDANKY
jgi:hypothetical protein